MVDREMQADTAVAPEIIGECYPFSTLKEKANVLLFRDLTSADVAYKLLAWFGGATAIGANLLGHPE